MVKSINADVLAIGRELKNAKSIAVTQHGGDKNSSYAIGESPVTVVEGRVTVGAFRDEKAGKHFAMVTDLDYKSPTDAALRIANASSAVERFDPQARTWSAIAPIDGALRMALPAGAGVLLRWSDANAVR
jgi:hypothetical protein